MRKSEIETRPCATICSTAPSKPRSVPANRPSAISPDCASDEYATTPRKSGARKASSEPYTSVAAASASIVVR